jgi:dihydroorotase
VTDSLVLAGARIVDPATRTDRIGDLWIDARGVHDSRPAGFSERETVDLAGKVVCPAFVEIHAHLREPGGEESETIASGCAAARAGGYGDVLAMANSPRTNDRPEVTSAILATAAAQGGGVRVHPVSAATIGLAGKEPAPWREMVAVGCVAISDDGKPVADAAMLGAVLAATSELGVSYLSHAECPPHFHGPVHDGDAARKFGVEGIPVECESDAVRAELDLARKVGGRIHVCHVSTSASLAALASARDAGVRVTSEATPHHLVLTDAEFLARGPDPNLKMNPPLRPASDRAALQAAVMSGLVGSIATDHAPHAPRLKARGLADAPFGVIGMETAFAVVHEALVVRGGWDLTSLVRALTTSPAEAVGIRAGRLFEGPPRFTILDPLAPWEVRPESFASLSRNCPFAGHRGTGRVAATFLADRLVASRAPG